MLVNRMKKPYEVTFDIRKFDSFKTSQIYKLSRTKILKLLYKSYLAFFNPCDLRISFRRYITWYRKKSTIDLYKRLCVVCLF